MAKSSIFVLVLVLSLFSSPGRAQTRFEPWIARADLAEWPTRAHAPEEFAAGLPGALRYLENEERELIAMKVRIEGFGHSTIDFLNLIAAMSEDPSQRANVRAVLAQVRPMILALNVRLDNYIQDTLDLSIAMTLYSVRDELARAPKVTADMRRLFRDVIAQRDLYLANKKEYGEGKDTKRTSAYNAFFVAAKKLFDALDRPDFSRARRASGKISRWMDAAAWALSRPALLGQFLKTLAVVLRSPQPALGQNPVVAAVMSLSRQLGRELGLEVIVEGKENLVAPGPNEVTVLVPSHREMIKDQIGIASLHFEDGTPFDSDVIAPFAAAHVYPGFIVDRLNPNNGIVVVGPKANPKPIEKAVRILEQSDLRMFMNYAGGRLPEGLGASMGARKKFFAMIRTLEDQGFKVNLLAISMRDNAKLFGTRSLTRNEGIAVKVAPVLRHDTRHLIMELGGEDAVGLMMRLGLIQDLITNDELIFGQVRGSRLNSALSEYLFGQVDCERLLGP